MNHNTRSGKVKLPPEAALSERVSEKGCKFGATKPRFYRVSTEPKRGVENRRIHDTLPKLSKLPLHKTVSATAYPIYEP